jgi:hypothetical protein
MGIQRGELELLEIAASGDLACERGQATLHIEPAGGRE